MVSEKAKGKQRAIDLNGETEAHVELKSLVIRFTEGIPDLTLHISESDAIRDIKREVRSSMLYHDVTLTIMEDT